MSKRNSQGAATVFALALVGALTALAWGCCSAVAVVVAHRQAQNAADLAALAGAIHEQSGCDVASRVTSANGARLVSCSVTGGVVTVQVVVQTSLGTHVEIQARARAGPPTS